MKVMFNSIPSLLKAFRDEKTCKIYLASIRFTNGIFCPHCGDTAKIYTFRNGTTYKCSACRMKFNSRTGTIFENTKLPLQKWFLAIYLITSSKKGISSLQASKHLDVSQKTAWYMMHRVRHALTAKTWEKSTANEYELDETYVGGKVSNMHNSKRKAIKNNTSPLIKTVVLGVLERDGIVRARVVSDTNRSTVLPILLNTLKMGAVIYTDSAHLYTPLGATHVHHSVNHEEKEYVRDGNIHTNTIEGFWSLLKRGIIGVYHYMSPEHLDKYLNEFTFRYNSKKTSDFDRFNLMLSKSMGRLTYKELTYNGKKEGRQE